MFKKPLFLVGLLWSHLALSQPLQVQYEFANWFDHQVGKENIGLYEGSVYSIGIKSKDTHPFFGERNGYLGDIVYGGQLYRDVHILYDLTRDQFLLTNPYNFSFTDLILINQNEISAVSLGDAQFISTTIGGKTGFYELVYKGATGIEILARHEKTGMVDNLEYIYLPQSTYFIRTANIAPTPFRLNAVFQLYPMHKKQIRKFISSRNLTITQENPADLVILADYLTRMNF